MTTIATPSRSITGSTGRLLILGIAAAALFGFVASDVASAKTITVCKPGCKVRTITAAVKQARKGDTIKVKPGVYPESVFIKGSRYDNLKIFGTTANRKKMPLLTGTRARPQTDFGILAQGVDGFQLKNLRGANYTGTAFFVRGDYGDSGPAEPCKGYKFSNLVAYNNVKYGLYARNCIGGQMTRSEAYINGDAGVYIGETPEQDVPVWTDLSYLKMHKNVLGYSGTNSRYVDINNSQFFNNGAGIVPNTLDSEGFEPTANGKIRDNQIFWNNFNHYANCAGSKTGDTPACSPIPRSWVGNLGTVGGVFTIYYPTGIGVLLHGSTGWEITDNDIFGNNKWGVGIVSDPFNDADDAVGNDNQVRNNVLSRGGADSNGFDFYWDYAGSNQCFSGNGSFTSENATSSPAVSDSDLYPTACPGTTGTGTKDANGGQFNVLLDLVTGGLNSFPSPDPEKMQCLWERDAADSHAAYPGFTYYRVTKPITCS
jgi:hypothetical protein